MSRRSPYSDLAEAVDVTAYEWDPVAQAAYLSFDRPGSDRDLFISFENAQSAQAKLEYIRSRGLGGLAIWELTGGYQRQRPEGERDVLLQGVKLAIEQSAEQPADAGAERAR